MKRTHNHKLIRMFKKQLADMFKDPFLVKQDHINVVVSKITKKRQMLEHILWSDK